MNKNQIQKIKDQYLAMINQKNFDHFINPNIIKLEDGLAEGTTVQAVKDPHLKDRLEKMVR